MVILSHLLSQFANIYFHLHKCNKHATELVTSDGIRKVPFVYRFLFCGLPFEACQNEDSSMNV